MNQYSTEQLHEALGCGLEHPICIDVRERQSSPAGEIGDALVLRSARRWLSVLGTGVAKWGIRDVVAFAVIDAQDLVHVTAVVGERHLFSALSDQHPERLV